MATRVEGEHIKIIHVPPEAGTHFAGQCKAPDALINDEGLVGKLQSAGYHVSVDDGLVSNDDFAKAAPWTPSLTINGARNEDKTVAVMK